MTVADLIKELQKFDQSLEVWGNSVEGGSAFQLSQNPFYMDNIGDSGSEWFASRDVQNFKIKTINKKVVCLLDTT